VLFSDSGAFVCPLSNTYTVNDDSDPPCKVLVGNILYPVLAEYQFNPPLLSLAMALGFFVGALFWGLSSDIWGRRCVFLPLLLRDDSQWSYLIRYAFNITLLIGGSFGVAAGGANSFVALAVLLALVGMGIGGKHGLPC